MSTASWRFINRRQFLKAGVAAASFATLPAAGGNEPKSPYGNFTVGVQSWSFREFNAEATLKRTQELGLHFIEFAPGQQARLRSKPPQIEALKRLCAAYDIRPIAYGVVKFTKDHDDNDRIFRFGKALGITGFSADPDPDSFPSLNQLVAKYNIAVGIHPHGPLGPVVLGHGVMHRWYSAEVILQAVKDLDPRIGACLDTGHLIRAGLLGKHLDPVQQIRLMGERNIGIHLKDNDNRTGQNVVLGKGALDVPGVLKALRDVKFKGWLSLEYEAHPQDPSPDMRACLEVLQQAVKRMS